MSPGAPGTIAGTARAIARGELSAREAVAVALERIRAGNARLNCVLQTLDDDAMARAEEIDALRRSGAVLPALAGVPIALKDNICLDRGRTTCASRFLERYESPFSATSAARLELAGAIIVAKTNMDEFAMGSSGEHSAFGPVRNPLDTTRVPGGSSAGSAAAVAAGMVPGALGSDTGGSIRQPAAMCGLVGLKPSYGRVSRLGLVAFASSLDQIGPITRTVEDAAMLLDAISGHDPGDSTCLNLPPTDAMSRLEAPIEGLRVGVARGGAEDIRHAGVRGVFERAVEAWRGLGAAIVEVEMPALRSGAGAIAAYYLICAAEASSNLARYDGVRYGRRADLGPEDGLEALYTKSRSQGFGPEVQRRIMLGTHVLSSGYYDAYYLTAARARRLIRDAFDAVFTRDGCHVLLTPATPEPAFRIGEKSDDPMTMYLEDLFTVPANLAGVPAVALPAGVVEEGGARLPVGVQLHGAPLQEETLLRAARMFERAIGFDGQPPAGA